MTPTEIEAGDERRVLEALAHKRLGPHWGWPDRFNTLVDAGAYLDAAMMLVPEGLAVTLDTRSPPAAALQGDGPHGAQGAWLYAPTPALALCAAIARATPPTA